MKFRERRSQREREERIPQRSEVPEQFKWALEDIYATDEKWAEDLQKLKAYNRYPIHYSNLNANSLLEQNPGY